MPDFSFEDELTTAGHLIIAGVDEAGRGPLAGPVVAAAAVLPRDFSNDFLDDSKKLTKKRREILYDMLRDNPRVKWAIGMVENEKIDEINILRATHLAMAKALSGLEMMPNIALVDGLPVKGLPCEHQAVVKGDGLSLSIAAASIFAKVSRDAMMAEIDREFPEYGFIRHQGYGTKEHREALAKYGPCRYHRRTFQPVSQLCLPLE